MRLILFDGPDAKRANFYPLSLSRPVWELRVGMSSLADKIIAALGLTDVACFVPEYMADSYRARTSWKVNDPSTLTGDDLMIVNARLKADTCSFDADGGSMVCLDGDGDVLCARIRQDDLDKVETACLDCLLATAKKNLPQAPTCDCQTWNYTWDLVLANPDVLSEDFAKAGRGGIEGTVEQPNAIRGDEKNIYIAPGAVVHPMVVLDAEHGPIYLDEDVEVHPFTRIEGPCYVGRKSILLGAKCREGMSIGPVCRVGGEVEESIIHGHSNKYHDGFLGHAYVGEWVNLGALTTNSDLKNDYGNISVTLDGKTPIDTGSTKVGSLIGDHTKTSIGTLFNTGSYVGAMCLIMANGKPLPKHIPDFAWMIDGIVTKGFGRKKLYETARTAMSRRKAEWTEAEEKMWEAVFEMTADIRDPAIKKGRKSMLSGR
jgi:UDP-N-acetylglucosamine diphosphorylase/glucosamine-1-phosphate N-acetyltransferase